MRDVEGTQVRTYLDKRQFSTPWSSDMTINVSHSPSNFPPLKLINAVPSSTSTKEKKETEQPRPPDRKMNLIFIYLDLDFRIK